MRYEDFWYNYTLREFWNAVNGFFEGENEKVREDWEQTRMIVGLLANQNQKHPKAFDKILPFPWDEKVEADQDTVERLKKHMEEANKKLEDGN